MGQVTNQQDNNVSITITYSVQISASEEEPTKTEQETPKKKKRPQYEVIRTTGIGFMPSQLTTASLLTQSTSFQ